MSLDDPIDMNCMVEGDPPVHIPPRSDKPTDQRSSHREPGSPRKSAALFGQFSRKLIRLSRSGGGSGTIASDDPRKQQQQYPTPKESSPWSISRVDDENVVVLVDHQDEPPWQSGSPIKRGRRPRRKKGKKQNEAHQRKRRDKPPQQRTGGKGKNNIPPNFVLLSTDDDSYIEIGKREIVPLPREDVPSYDGGPILPSTASGQKKQTSASGGGGGLMRLFGLDTQMDAGDLRNERAGETTPSASSNRPRNTSISTSTTPTTTTTMAFVGEYQLGRIIGRGGFGCVHIALNTSTGELVAVKSFSINDVSFAALSGMLKEADLLKELSHPNVVKFQGCVTTKTHFYMLLEFMEGGSLSKLIKSFGPCKEDLASSCMLQVLNGLSYLHAHGVIHRDIKGSNVLMSKTGDLKLADFGVATTCIQPNELQPGGRRFTVVGTPYWMAPEVVDQAGHNFSSDIWSVGSLAHEMVKGEPPLYHLPPLSAMYHIVREDMEIPKTFSGELTCFIKECWQKNPRARPTAKKLIHHSWIKKFQTQQKFSELVIASVRKKAKRNRPGIPTSKKDDSVVVKSSMLSAEEEDSDEDEAQPKTFTSSTITDTISQVDEEDLSELIRLKLEQAGSSGGTHHMDSSKEPSSSPSEQGSEYPGLSELPLTTHNDSAHMKECMERINAPSSSWSKGGDITVVMKNGDGESSKEYIDDDSSVIRENSASDDSHSEGEFSIEVVMGSTRLREEIRYDEPSSDTIDTIESMEMRIRGRGITNFTEKKSVQNHSNVDDGDDGDDDDDEEKEFPESLDVEYPTVSVHSPNSHLYDVSERLAMENGGDLTKEQLLIELRRERLKSQKLENRIIALLEQFDEMRAERDTLIVRLNQEIARQQGYDDDDDDVEEEEEEEEDDDDDDDDEEEDTISYATTTSVHYRSMRRRLDTLVPKADAYYLHMLPEDEPHE